MPFYPLCTVCPWSHLSARIGQSRPRWLADQPVIFSQMSSLAQMGRHSPTSKLDPQTSRTPLRTYTDIRHQNRYTLRGTAGYLYTSLTYKLLADEHRSQMVECRWTDRRSVQLTRLSSLSVLSVLSILITDRHHSSSAHL